MTSPADLPPAAASLQTVMAARQSCRGFLPREIPRETLDAMLAMAQASPSWCNVQPWQLILTTGAATDRLRAALATHLGDPPAPDIAFPERYVGEHQERRRECARQLYEAVGVTWGDRAASLEQSLRNFAFFGAPHVIILTTAKILGVYGTLDCGIYLGHLLLAAQSLGLGTIAQAAPAAYSPVLHQHLGIPDDRQVICAVSLGYVDPDHAANRFRTRRVTADSFVRFDA